MSDNFYLRKAEKKDCQLILNYIKELAEYEKMLDEVTATIEDIEKTLFGPRVYAECFLAYENDESIGFALFFHSYSTFVGKPRLYLEDLYIKPAFRGKGYGKTILAHLAKEALARNCEHMDWQVLDWNKPSIDFYNSLGANHQKAWWNYRLQGEHLKALAETV